MIWRSCCPTNDKPWDSWIRHIQSTHICPPGCCRSASYTPVNSLRTDWMWNTRLAFQCANYLGSLAPQKKWAVRYMYFIMLKFYHELSLFFPCRSVLYCIYRCLFSHHSSMFIVLQFVSFIFYIQSTELLWILDLE